jgi:regulator of sigma E protease
MLDSRDTASGPPLAPQLAAQAFDRQPLRSRVWIVLAGPLANLILAWCLYVSIAWGGVHELAPWMGTAAPGSPASVAGLAAGDEITQSRVGQQDWRAVRGLSDVRAAAADARDEGADLYLRVRGMGQGPEREIRLNTQATQDAQGQGSQNDALKVLGLAQIWAEPVLSHVVPTGAADKAGLKPGDKVVAVNDIPIADAAALRHWIEKSVDASGKASVMHWTVERSGPPEGTRRLEVDVIADVVGEAGSYRGRAQIQMGAAPKTVWVQKGLMEGLADGARQWW